MSSYSIRGNEVIFRNINSGNPSNIKLKHENPKNQLVFGSEVIFNMDTSHTTITLGAYQISVNNQDLVVKKNGNITLKLTQ